MIPLRVLFMGSPQFAVAALSAILGHPNAQVVAVVTQPDQPKGRGKHSAQTAVNVASQREGLPVFTPTSKRELTKIIKELHPDIIVVVAYGRILPAAITDQYLCLNVHGSLLPKYRGASPIHAALMKGDTLTGVTLMQMNAKMDEGAILSVTTTDIVPEDCFQTLHDRLSEMGGGLLSDFFDSPKTILTQARVQNNNEASYCQKLQAEDALLRSDRSSLENWGIIRAFSPMPGAYVLEAGKRIKIIEATLLLGKLVPVLVKPEGKGVMSYADYQRGRGSISFFE